MTLRINHGPIIMAVLWEAKVHFGSPSTWDYEEVGRWVQRRVRSLVDGSAEPAPPRPSHRSSRLALVPLVPDDERAAIQDEDLLSSEDGWR